MGSNAPSTQSDRARSTSMESSDSVLRRGDARRRRVESATPTRERVVDRAHGVVALHDPVVSFRGANSVSAERRPLNPDRTRATHGGKRRTGDEDDVLAQERGGASSRRCAIVFDMRARLTVPDQLERGAQNPSGAGQRAVPSNRSTRLTTRVRLVFNRKPDKANPPRGADGRANRDRPRRRPSRATLRTPRETPLRRSRSGTKSTPNRAPRHARPALRADPGRTGRRRR